MVANDYLLQTVGKRIQFWRDRLQAAFRSGDTERIAQCTRVLEEYGVLTTQAANEQTNVQAEPKA